MAIFTEKDDYQKFFIELPEPGFSPERNKAVVEGTIKKHNAMIYKKKHEHDEAYGERADAVVSYLRHAEKKPGYLLKTYFGRQMLAYLRGEEIRKKLLANMRILDPKGRDVTHHYM